MRLRSGQSGARRLLGYLAFAFAAAAVFALGFFDTGALMRATGQSDLVLHAGAFGMLGGLGRLLWPALPVLVGLVTLIVGLELAQHFSPWHETGVLDVLAGASGAGLGIWVTGAGLRYANVKQRGAAE